MAVIFAQTATTLGTASGFQSTLSSNLGTFNATELSLSSTRTIAFTPSAGEPCRGVQLALSSISTTAVMKSVVVTLQENVAAVWTDRATQTISGATITNSATSAIGIWIVTFDGGTFPYTVTAAAGTWRFSISSSGAESTHWSLRTSDGTNPYFCVIGDTAVTASSGNDAIVCGAKVTADMDFTLKGVAITGDATRSVCCVLGRSATPTPDSVSMFDIEFDTGSWDVTLDGLFVNSAHAGVRIGTHVVFTAAPAAGATSATLTSNWTHTTGTYSMIFDTGEYKVVTLTNGATTCTWSGGLAEAQTIYAGVGQPVANPCSFQIIRATTGTATISGFSTPTHLVTVSGPGARGSHFFMGEVPVSTLEDDTLARDVLEQGNVTITIASPAVVTYTAHGVSNGTIIQLSTTGALPTGLAVATDYYIVNQATNTFQLSLTEGGAAINTSGSQSGTHTVVPIIETTNSTGWVSGDRVFLGGQDVKGTGDRNVYTVSSTSTTRVTLTASLTTNARKSCSAKNHIMRFNGYGASVVGSSTSTGIGPMQVGTPSNFVIFGTQCQYVGFTGNSNGATSVEDSTKRSPIRLVHSSAENYAGTSTTYLMSAPATLDPYYAEHVNLAFMALGTYTNGGSCNQKMRFKYCNFLTPGPVNAGGALNFVAGWSPEIYFCSFENGNNSMISSLAGSPVIVEDTHFWGNSASLGSAYRISTAINIRNARNSYQNLTGAINLQTTITGIEKNSLFGNIVANTNDINGTTASYFDMEYYSSSGTMIINTTEGNSSSVQQTTGTNIVTPGSNLRITDANDVANVDTIYQPYGTWVRTGYNLSDTTVWTGTAFGAASSGQFGWRGAPRSSSSSTSPLEYSWDFTTGNCQNLTLSVMARVKINAAAYYAGTHVNPTLTVTYDDGASETSSVATATTADQQLYVSFIPTTTFGKITINISASTDATGTDAYFYVGEIIPSRPPGIAVNTTRLAQFSGAAPLPPDSTFTVPASVWDELATAHTVSGSFGEQATNTNVEALNFLAGDKLEGA